MRRFRARRKVVKSLCIDGAAGNGGEDDDGADGSGVDVGGAGGGGEDYGSEDDGSADGGGEDNGSEDDGVGYDGGVEYVVVRNEQPLYQGATIGVFDASFLIQNYINHHRLTVAAQGGLLNLLANFYPLTVLHQGHDFRYTNIFKEGAHTSPITASAHM